MNGQLVFLLGVMPRSGTNFLSSLLACHQDIAESNYLKEDFFVSHLDKLYPFIRHTSRLWHPRWDPNKEWLTQANLAESLGRGISDFICNQQSQPTPQPIQHLIQKTPSVRNLALFRQFFPENKIVLLVRDGRSVVYSGQKSFGWQFDKAAYDWAMAINDIHAFLSCTNPDNALLVRYEDLYNQRQHEVDRMLAFLSLNKEDFDWGKADALGVSGSSDTADKYGEVTWQEKEQPSDNFKPLDRFESWPNWKKNRFNWIAGEQARTLGYEVPAQKGVISSFNQRFWDLSWPLRMLPSVGYNLTVKKRFILKCH